MLGKIFNKVTSNYPDETIDILRLIRSNNIGPRTFYNLLKYYGSPKAAIENLPAFMEKCGKSKYLIFSLDEALYEIEKMEKEGAKFLTFKDPAYPLLLKQIEDAPPIISYKGNIKLLSKDSAAIVGARNCSIAGKELASKVAKELSNASITVVSGLARGIDTAAHLATEPNTIAVIAGGIDNIYPPENHKLYKRIAESGLLIAELPIGSVPLARHFPQRNRIIAGLCKATIVIEASLNSGSLITARFALEQNREIYASPGYPLDPRCKGTNKLIKEGAILLDSSEEIIEYYRNTSTSSANEEKDEITPAAIYTKTDESLVNNENKELILASFSSFPVSIEDLIQQTKLPISIITAILLELELTEKIVYQPGNRIVLNFAKL